MEWEFTAQQVVKGKVDYNLESFRNDLAREVRMNLGDSIDTEFQELYALIYDMCYWLATEKPLEDYLAQFKFDPATGAFLESMQEYMLPNIEMLGAILQRLIMERVEANMPLEQAVQSVAEYHDRLVRTHRPVSALPA